MNNEELVEFITSLKSHQKNYLLISLCSFLKHKTNYSFEDLLLLLGESNTDSPLKKQKQNYLSLLTIMDNEHD